MARNAVALSVCLVLVLRFASANEEELAKLPLREAAAEAVVTAEVVLAALKADDAASLVALAKTQEPGHWFVVDELCAQGRYDAAEAFARAIPAHRPSTRELPAYVAFRRDKPTEHAARAAMNQMNRALLAEQWQEALDAGAGFDGPLDSIVCIRLLISRGVALQGMQQYGESAKALFQAAQAAHALGWIRGAIASYLCAGRSAHANSDWSGAHDAWNAQLVIERERRSRVPIAETLRRLGVLQTTRGNVAEAHALFAEEATILREHKESLGARALRKRAAMHRNESDYGAALELLNKSLKTFRKLNQPGLIAAVLLRLSEIHRTLGNYPEALRLCDETLAAYRVLDNQPGVAWALGNIGTLQSSLGNHETALRYIERSLQVFRKLGPPFKVAGALRNLGHEHLSLGDPTAALRFFHQSLAAFRALDRNWGSALVLISIGNVHAGRLNMQEALKHYTEALEILRGTKSKAGIATALCSVGAAKTNLGDYAGARTAFEEATELLESTWVRSTQARVAWGLADLNLRQDQNEEAVRVARKGVELVAGLAEGLAESEGAGARDMFVGLFDVGYRAALRAGKVDDLLWFLEQGRAGSLREALGSRSALEAAVIPLELRKALALVRHRERRALDAYRKARAAGRFNDAKAARRTLHRAQAEVGRAQARIQREAKAAAAVTLAPPDDLDSIRSRLRPNEALLLLGLTSDEAFTLIVRADGVRICALAKASKINAAVAALTLEDRQADPNRAITRLRTLLVEPLGLPKDVTRVLISPTGRLGYVPFALLFPEREVALVPSGTTHGLLLEQAAQLAAKGNEKHGRHILALGDPDYGTIAKATADGHRGRGLAELVPLPATRAEVNAIGTTKLLGAEASESGLKARIQDQPHWRAVHFACHGLVDPDRPMLSALALSADEKNDGFLTALAIFRMRIPADLVVLSACETGRGKIYETEGIVGLARAFMFAGAPRVICSLWKVDDRATHALMIKFYELWSPKDGSKGLGAAAALKQAQAHIRRQEGWKHPYYWAAWTLWGLPD